MGNKKLGITLAMGPVSADTLVELIRRAKKADDIQASNLTDSAYHGLAVLLDRTDAADDLGLREWASGVKRAFIASNKTQVALHRDDLKYIICLAHVFIWNAGKPDTLSAEALMRVGYLLQEVAAHLKITLDI